MIIRIYNKHGVVEIGSPIMDVVKLDGSLTYDNGTKDEELQTLQASAERSTQDGKTQ